MTNLDDNSQDRRATVFFILSGFFIANAVLAELIGSKIFSVEKTLGWDPVSFWVWKDGFNLSAGVLIWPVVFIVSDIINEYFGKKGLMHVTFVAMGLIAYASVSVFLTTKLSPADFWLQTNSTTPDGGAFDINYAFGVVYQQSVFIILASLISFALGQLLDAVVFQQIKRRTGGKMIWLRATASTVVSQLVDSFLILFLAFWFFPYLAGMQPWSPHLVLAVGFTQYTYKLLLSVGLLPILYLVHGAIDRYLGLAKP